MQLLLLFSAILAALVGNPAARVAPAQPVAAERSVAPIAAAKAVAAILPVVLAALYVLARRALPLPRSFALALAFPIYASRRRE